MRIRYDPRARDETFRAARFLEDQERGLGSSFLSEIDNAVYEIAASPMIWPIAKRGARKRVLTSRFPYSIIYKKVAGEIVVVAVAHWSRSPNYWLSRLD